MDSFEDKNCNEDVGKLNDSLLENEDRPKKIPKIEIKEADTDSICLSRQLQRKRKRLTNASKPRLEKQIPQCGVPMPSKAELKKMFADSDEDEISNPKEPISLETLNEITAKAIDILQNRQNDLILEISDPKLPVVPQKRKGRKHSTPHIVHATVKATDSTSVNSTVGVGDKEYGVDRNIIQDESQEIHQKRKRRQRHVRYPRNPACAAQPESYCSSNGSSELNSKLRAFSPIPSTSRDNETFEKNDFLLQSSALDSSNDTEIIEPEIETIVIDDQYSPSCNIQSEDNPEVIIETDSTLADDVVVLDDTIPSFKSFSEILHEINNNDDDDCEIIDVDSIIAENNSILQKYNNKKKTALTEPIILDEIEISDLTKQETQPKEQIAIIVENFFKDYNFKQEDTSCIRSLNLKAEPSTLEKLFTKIISCITSTLQCANHFIKAGHLPQMVYEETSQITPRKKQSRQNLNQKSPQQNLLNNYARNLQIQEIVDLGSVSEPVARKNLNNITNTLPTYIVPTPTALAMPLTQPASPVGKSLGDCPVCMENLASKPIASTICGHIFCMSCIQTVVKTAGGKKCPTCRKPFKKGTNYHPIFL